MHQELGKKCLLVTHVLRGVTRTVDGWQGSPQRGHPPVADQEACAAPSR
jgi:hypothetical protein